MSALQAGFALRRLLPFLVVAAHHLLMPMAMAVSLTNLTVGDVLTPPGYITSSSGAFAFGFRAHDTDPAKFILATWFLFGSRRPRSHRVGHGHHAQHHGALTLADGSSQVLWTISTAGTRRGSVLMLNGSVSTLQGMLFSKRTDTEFTTGRFSLAAQEDGNIVLCADLFTGDLMHNAYWATGTNVPGGNTTITFDDRDGLSYTLYDGSVNTLISPMVELRLRRKQQPLLPVHRMDPDQGQSQKRQAPGLGFAPDPDGIVRTYFRPHKTGGENTSWTVSGTLPSEGGCNLVKPQTGTVQSMCGLGSYCVETKERLSCMCPPGYTYIDAQHTDSGCTLMFVPQSCDLASSRDDKSSDEFSLEISIYYKTFPSVTEEHDCFCTAALVINGSYCEEVGALANGRQGDDVTMINALIKYLRQSTARNKMPRPYKIVAVCLGSLFEMITVGILVAAQHYLGRRNRENQQPLCSSVRAFSRKELYQATNGFDKLLGKGSFGEVYKGTVRSLKPHLIAVKKLIDSNEYSKQEFTNEVQSIRQIHHRNLVRMIGYCKQGKHRMLVFEFMPGGSLRSFLFNPQKRRPPWRWRAKASVSIARGLEYLHDGCNTPIIHCDIKPDNILLDDHGVPRITDFGISKLLRSQQVHTTVTHVRGTRGYIAPEWLRGNARVDTKADVYSFSVVLLEMICFRRCQEPVTIDTSHGGGGYDETVTLFGWAAQLVCARRAELLLHGGDADAVEDIEMVEKFARVALWCMEPNPAAAANHARGEMELKLRRCLTLPVSTLYIHSGNDYSRPHTGYNGQIGFHCVTRNRESQRLLMLSSSATNGFDKLLGKGSFAEVYKGTIRSPQPHVIAVKKLINSNKYRVQEFANNVQFIGHIHHQNYWGKAAIITG
ncbi:hypothetical protein HU200_042612 [Digitaria exilis]|uniref:non-specific serine/threonine protein kinase n=1 Tax=Digitaria exilis TaxID=1010633 RepID=A0A835EEI6_9POAL|nr:hypothetical protein HU200_042612 [Digitaria exilis]